MAVSLEDLARAIATRAAQTGIRAEFFVPEDVQPPACFVNFGTIERQSFVMGIMDIEFELVVLTARADARTGQLAIYGFANPDWDDNGSLWAAFETDKDLGLTGVDVTLLRYRPLGIEEIAAYGYYGGAFEGRALITKGAS
jgi:hypothetical protein